MKYVGVVNLELQVKLEEIDNLIEYVKLYQDTKIDKVDKLALITSLKANLIIMIYACVESTVTHVMQIVHREIIQNGTKYEQLNDCLQMLIIGYYKSLYVNQNRLENIKEFIDFVNYYALFNIEYNEYIRFIKGFDGNVDCKELAKFLKKYGIEVKFDDKWNGITKKVKENRNSLAHGRMSFEDVGKQLSINEVLSYRIAINEFLQRFLKLMDAYLDEKQYLTEVCENRQR